MLESFFKSLSSFSVGLLFYSLTKSMMPWFPCLPILVLVFSILISMALYSYYRTFKSGDCQLEVVELQPVEQELIPSYIGLFIILISLGELDLVMQGMLIVLLFIIWLFLLERSYYFNLLWLFKLRYYKVKDKYGNTYLIYSSKKDLKKNFSIKEVICFKKLVKVNNFTFIDKESDSDEC